MAPPRWTRRLFRPEDLEAIARAVREAEAGTSAEIRVHLEPRLPRAAGGGPREPLERAREVFAGLGMHRTALRNGVLVYLALEDRKLALLGDEGIHNRVGAAYWEAVCDAMVTRLRQQAARDAVVTALADLGRVLAHHFPRGPDDRNELSDQVSLG